jgi:peptidoglycan/LPS O-acetylase OafA/YrhL
MAPVALTRADGARPDRGSGPGAGAPKAEMGLTGRCMSLDALRGLAAFAVLIFHFPHVYSVQPTHPAAGQRLFETLLWPIYDHGWMAVDLFFQLSGFVFFWLYATAIAERRIDGSSFFALRLFRLYPLHLATLLIVAVEQWTYGRVMGGSFVYTAQDGWHFALNLVMANGLPFAGAESFNGPSWSLSIEMALYGLFFLLMRWRGTGIGLAGAMVVVGLAVYKFDSALGRGIAGFYLGGLLFLLLQRFGMARFRRIAALLALGALVATLGLWWVAHALPAVGGRHLLFGVQLTLRFLAFPALTAVALTLDTALAPLWRRLVWLGDISYSTYLLHIPLQITLVLASVGLGIGRGWLVTPLGLSVYLGLVTALGWISFHGFEQPLRRRLKRALGKSRSKPGDRRTAAPGDPALAGGSE